MKIFLSIWLMTLFFYSYSASANQASSSNAYLFSFKDINGEKIHLNKYQGKVILVVNTASLCGYTPQYARLESLYRAYKTKGLEIIGVPSPDFGNQEYDNNLKIKSFTENTYGISFKLMSPVHVAGKNAHPFYQWANSQFGHMGAPKWNFHKYLINKKGQLIAWFPSSTSPDSSQIKRAIEQSLYPQ